MFLYITLLGEGERRNERNTITGGEVGKSFFFIIMFFIIIKLTVFVFLYFIKFTHIKIQIS